MRRVTLRKVLVEQGLQPADKECVNCQLSLDQV
jgi:hypothetical protein